MDETAPNYREHVAGEIRAELARRRMDAKTLAAGVRMTEATLSRRLSGQTSFLVDEVAAIAAFLEVPLAQFLPPDRVGAA